ncbi:MAG: hypothetical protein HFJ40_00825 [Clostridia bacterium]|nr:hypothetical protein [Clostridia bacterium]
MFKNIINNYKNLEKSAYKIMKTGLKFCFALCIISISILLTYEVFITSPYIYYIGMSLFRLSIIFGIEFIICAFVVDGIKNQLI